MDELTLTLLTMMIVALGSLGMSISLSSLSNASRFGVSSSISLLARSRMPSSFSFSRSSFACLMPERVRDCRPAPEPAEEFGDDFVLFRLGKIPKRSAWIAMFEEHCSPIVVEDPPRP